MSSRSRQQLANRSLFWVSLPICAAVAGWGILDPPGLAAAANAVTSAAFEALDWFFMLALATFLVVIGWLGIGKYGRIKLGRPEDQPEFSVSSWMAMLFSAGMGVGLLFWGVAEPLTHFASPPTGQGGTPEAARAAMLLANFHWGLHAWAVYGIGALILAYFGFRRGEPYLAGAPIRCAFEGRWVGPVAWLADVIAVLAVAFGVAGSLGMGAEQIHSGLHVVMGVPAESQAVTIGIVVALVISYMASAATSLDKGIKWLSNINMWLALFLMAYVLIAGPTSFILATLVTALGDYASHFMGLALQLYPFSDVAPWLQSWTLTYFIWWIAWAPFVGIFIARISRGRTIREFVLGVLLAPTLLSMVWFAVFGGTGLHEELYGQIPLAVAVREDVTVALFLLFEALPLSPVLGAAALLLLFIFVITSADSATFVLGMLTSNGSVNPPVARKLVWGITLGGLSMGLILTRSIDAIKAVAVIGAIPFAFVLLLQMVALLRVLPEDRDRAEEPTAEDEDEDEDEDEEDDPR